MISPMTLRTARCSSTSTFTTFSWRNPWRPSILTPDQKQRGPALAGPSVSVDIHEVGHNEGDNPIERPQLRLAFNFQPYTHIGVSGPAGALRNPYGLMRKLLEVGSGISERYFQSADRAAPLVFVCS